MQPKYYDVWKIIFVIKRQSLFLNRLLSKLHKLFLKIVIFNDHKRSILLLYHYYGHSLYTSTLFNYKQFLDTSHFTYIEQVFFSNLHLSLKLHPINYSIFFLWIVCVWFLSTFIWIEDNGTFCNFLYVIHVLRDLTCIFYDWSIWRL